MRFRLSKIFATITAISVLLAIGTFVVITSQAIRGMFEPVYRNWLAADLVIEHLKSDGGEWPRSWDDLADDHRAIVAVRGGAIPFEQLVTSVQIDWKAKVGELRQLQENGTPTFVVICSLDGSTPHVSGNEPNQMILDYLNNN